MVAAGFNGYWQILCKYNEQMKLKENRLCSRRVLLVVIICDAVRIWWFELSQLCDQEFPNMIVCFRLNG